ncbi:proline iminopeptidase-family hydrolase [Terriglobus saanensis]|uniref:Proline-specific peptidase n=1 Tax=Terriglobus saanensis (strain ATCC BAA-1853 / DSM 23119 / SP1PR4) TaxID=401053 RepID=E8V0D5_TERSS|nr:proline iminopeptidase-family hydrolase [Terriglobus saanensis]ADV84418.1 proline-specific peptidase [Terriglobus saanensis SP1PR4]
MFTLTTILPAVVQRLRNLATLTLFLSISATAQAVPSTYALHDGYINAHGVMIYYKTIGERGAATPLVILHGGPGAAHDYFLPYLLPLAQHRQIVFIDERGSGRSQRLQDVKQYTAETMAEDVEDLRVSLHLGKIDLLGHSCGGVLAEAYALKYQQNLQHLILAGTFASTTKLNEVLAALRDRMPEPQRKRLLELEAQGLFGHGQPWERNRYTPEYEQLAWGTGYFPVLYGAHPDANYDPATGNAPSNWELYREMWGSDGEFKVTGNLREVEWVERLKTVHVPTLVMVGDHDEVSPELAKQIQTAISGAKLYISPNSGHMQFVDQPDGFNSTVDGFLLK